MIYTSKAVMQNSECIMHNYGIAFGDDFKSSAKRIHLFCILHYAFVTFRYEGKRSFTVLHVIASQRARWRGNPPL